MGREGSQRVELKDLGFCFVFVFPKKKKEEKKIEKKKRRNRGGFVF